MDRRNFLLLSTIAGLHSSGSPASELLRGSVGSPDVALRDKLMRDPLRS